MLFMASTSYAKPPHDGYISLFGWGGIAIMNVVNTSDYPPLSSFDASKFKYKNGVNHLKAGQPFAMRALFRDGKSIREQLAKLKSETGKDYPEYQVFYYTSHWKDGNALKTEDRWPKDINDIPTWQPLAKGYRAVISDRNLHFQGSGYDWNRDTPQDVRDWVKNISKPGHKMYIAIRFRRSAPDPSQKYWNSNTNRWVTPDTVYYSKPIAVTTIMFE